MARILVADDTPEMRGLIAEILADHYHITAVADGGEAWESIRRDPPDLIISDVHMPGESGFDFLALAKADATLRPVPFLLVSATSWDDGAGREAAEKGADLFLMRPIDPQRLLEHIRKLLGKRR